MQIQKVNSAPNFQGHGARKLGEVMERLYKDSYKSGFIPLEQDIIQLTSKMKDGKEVTAIADFYNGKFMGIAFPYDLTKYKSEFCNKLIETYNNAVTKNKATKRPRH